MKKMHWLVDFALEVFAFIVAGLIVSFFLSFCSCEDPPQPPRDPCVMLWKTCGLPTMSECGAIIKEEWPECAK